MKSDVMEPGGGTSVFHLVQGWESKVAAFVTAPPRVYPCSFSWTLSRLLLSSEAVNPLWPSGHEAEYNHWPQTSSCGCNHYLRAWPSLHLPADHPDPSEHSSSVPRALSAPSAMPPSTGRVQFLQCLLSRVEWSWPPRRPTTVWLSALQPNGVGWVPLDVDARRSSESLPQGFTFWLWSWPTLCTWAHLITSWSLSFLICQVEVVIPTSQDLRWCHWDPHLQLSPASL